jgi:sulfate adenylyltransferase subunit 2
VVPLSRKMRGAAPNSPPPACNAMAAMAAARWRPSHRWLASRLASLSRDVTAAIDEYRFDCCVGGARRDEEKARAKERFFSFRDSFGQWDPKNQRPEIWNLYNGRLNPGENMRVFPISNWTEMDVWEYIRREQLEVPNIYFSHKRACVRRGGQWLPVNALMPPKPNEEVRELVVRVRTIGDIISTGCVESPASTVDDIIAEIAAARVTERGSRADDKSSEAAMEDRKKAGYF